MRELGGSVLQSWEWGELRRRGGWEPLRLLDESGAAAQVLFRRLPALGSLAYVPHGPLCSDEGEMEKALRDIAALADGRGAYALRVEPRLSEERGFSYGGFVKSRSSVQPRCTFVVRIGEGPDEQLKALPKDARYGVRRARREGVEAAATADPEDLEEFIDLLTETAGRQSFALRSREYYQNFVRELPARVILARREGKLLAGAVILLFGEEAYYFYGASAAEDANLYASYLVQFEALSVARREGARRHDMWGIPCDPHENHPLWGIYQFKKKFGGAAERYVGAYEKSLSPLRARLAQTGLQGYYALQKLRGKTPGPPVDRT